MTKIIGNITIQPLFELWLPLFPKPNDSEEGRPQLLRRRDLQYGQISASVGISILHFGHFFVLILYFFSTLGSMNAVNSFVTETYEKSGATIILSKRVSQLGCGYTVRISEMRFLNMFQLKVRLQIYALL